MPVTIRGAGIVLLGYKFGINRTFPTPGEDGDEMSFAYDGVTYTPGELVGDSGSRDVDIELTLDGNAITSGTFLVPLIGVSDLTLDESTVFWAATGGSHDDIYFDSANGAAYFGLVNSDSLYFSWYLFFVAAEGHSKVTVSLGNSAAAAGNIYLIMPLPSGALDISDAISVPGVGE